MRGRVVTVVVYRYSTTCWGGAFNAYNRFNALCASRWYLDDNNVVLRVAVLLHFLKDTMDLKPIFRRRALIGWTGFVLCFGPAGMVLADVSQRVIVMSDRLYAGPGDGYLVPLPNATINNHGEIAFAGRLFVNNDVPHRDEHPDKGGVYRLKPGGGLELIAQNEVFIAPGVAGDVPVKLLLTPIINDRGDILFAGQLDTNHPAVSGYSQLGYWLYSGSGITKVLRAGDTVPGPDDSADYWYPYSVTMNDNSHVVLSTLLAGFGVSNDGIVGGPYDNLTAIARESDPSPVNPPSYDIRSVSRFPLINNRNQVLYGASAGPVNVWLYDAGVHEPVLWYGMPLESVSVDASFDQTLSANFNNAGHIVFGGRFSAPSLGLSRVPGLWTVTESGQTLIAKQGDAAPTADPTTVFNSFSSAAISDQGEVIFFGTISGDQTPQASSLWKRDDGGLHELVRVGDPAPGFELGTLFSSISSFQINQAGQLIFHASVEETSTNESLGAGIWAIDRDGSVLLLLHEQQWLDVNPDPGIEELKQVASFSINDPDWGGRTQGRTFNDRGELVVSVSFVDQSNGIFVVTVPEPGTIAALSLSFLGMLARRRRRSA